MQNKHSFPNNSFFPQTPEERPLDSKNLFSKPKEECEPLSSKSKITR